MSAEASNANEPSERKRGRPRSARAHHAILDAALELLIEQGYDAMSIEGVADRAGVGKATIYRRWDSKEDLVAEALGSQRREARMPDSGDNKEDVISLLSEDLEVVTSPYGQRALSQIVGASAKHPRFKEAYWHNAISPRRAAVVRILDRARERGELRQDADLELAVDMMVGPLFYQLLIKPDPVPSENLLRQAVETVWRSIAVRKQ